MKMTSVLCVALVLLAAAVGDAARMRYDAAEHKQLGGADYNSNDLTDTNPPGIHLPRKEKGAFLGLIKGTTKRTFSFGDLTAYAGDFLGPSTKNDVICMGKAPGGIVERFEKIVSALETESGGLKFAAEYFDQVDKEIKAVRAIPAAERGSKASKAMEGTQWSDIQWGTIHSAQLTMLKVNDDHFGRCAAATVINVMEGLIPKPGDKPDYVDAAPNALPMVVKRQGDGGDGDDEAKKKRRVKLGILSHFWTDQLAGGHVRTPRNALRKLCGDTAGGFMTNTMHNEDNYNGVPIRVTLPFRSSDNRIFLQEQKMTVKGDANYWTSGNEAKDRLAGFWRYVDEDMMKVMSWNGFAKSIPRWDRKNDDQTCPMFRVKGKEYQHMPDGSFDNSEKEVQLRLSLFPVHCEQKDSIAVNLFYQTRDVIEVKMNDKCCYFTKFDKKWCDDRAMAFLRKGTTTDVTPIEVAKEDTEEDPDTPRHTYISRYWRRVMRYIRDWNEDHTKKEKKGSVSASNPKSQDANQ